MTNVVCLKWGKKYDAVYVNNLHTAVRKHLSSEHRFLCITEDPSDVKCETVPLSNTNLLGWWNKLLFFQEQPFGITGTLLFLDLDIVVLESLDEFLLYKPEEDFVICQDFLKPSDINSSVFRLRVGSHPEVLQKFSPKETKVYWGDQNWIRTSIQRGWALWPTSWVRSYRKDCQPAVPGDTRIVAFHGKPKPHEFDSRSWVSKYWKEWS